MWAQAPACPGVAMPLPILILICYQMQMDEKSSLLVMHDVCEKQGLCLSSDFILYPQYLVIRRSKLRVKA